MNSQLNCQFTFTTESLIETIKTYPILYDMSDPDYKNIRKKDKIYEEIALYFNESGDEIKKKWKNLRDTYKKYLKQKHTTTGQACKSLTKWQWSGQMEFIRPFVSFSETASNVMPLYQIIDNETEIELPGSSKPKDLYVGQSVDVLEDTQLQTNAPFKKRRTNENSNKSSVESVVNYFENRHKKSADKDDLLFSSYAQTLKTFTPERQSSLKLEMAELFAKHERLHIKEKENAQ